MGCFWGSTESPVNASYWVAFQLLLPRSLLGSTERRSSVSLWLWLRDWNSEIFCFCTMLYTPNLVVSILLLFSVCFGGFILFSFILSYPFSFFFFLFWLLFPSRLPNLITDLAGEKGKLRPPSLPPSLSRPPKAILPSPPNQNITLLAPKFRHIAGFHHSSVPAAGITLHTAKKDVRGKKKKKGQEKTP